MPDTAAVPRTKFVHVELDFPVWLKLRQRLLCTNRSLKRHVTDLISADMKAHGDMEMARPARAR